MRRAQKSSDLDLWGRDSTFFEEVYFISRFFLENDDRPTFMNEGRAMEQADYGPPADSVSAGKGLKTPAVTASRAAHAAGNGGRAAAGLAGGAAG